MQRTSLTLRIALVLVTMASVLVPSLFQPARAITVPTTLARSMTASGAARVGYTFPATHVAFSWSGDEGTGVRYRTLNDGETTPWRRAWEAHDLEHGDHHYSGVLAVDRPDSVEWRPVTEPGLEMGAITIDYLNTLDGPRQRVEIPSVAGADATDPNIITRAEWGADESIKKTTGECKRLFYPVQQLFVHHTVGTNNDTHPRATMRSMYYFHTVTRGWCDLGYNFVISPDGRIFEGRWSRNFDPWEIHDSENNDNEAVQGAHTSGYNSGSVAVSLMGNYSTVRMTSEMRRSLVGFLAWEADRHNLRPKASHTYKNPATGLTRHLPVIAGHRDAGSTECPGNSVYRSLPELRQKVKNRMAEGKFTTGTTLSSLQPTAPAGTTVTFVGRLATGGGAGVVGRDILVHVKPRNKPWRHLHLATTTADGQFTFNQSPQRDLTVVAEFEGDNGLWRSQSKRVAQNVSNRQNYVSRST